MVVGLFTTTTPKPFHLIHSSYLLPKPNQTVFFPPSNLCHQKSTLPKTPRKVCFTVYVFMEDQEQSTHLEYFTEKYPLVIPSVRVAEKLARRKSERFIYLVAAVLSSFGITSMAVMAAYYRFYWQMEGGNVPLSEVLGAFALCIGVAVGVEFWARWAHRALWHASLWHIHESHHQPREGPFELNDVFFIINAGPAIALLSYGFFYKGLVPGLCFGAGLEITVLGMLYMLVHEGLVHKRFPVGPIANVPYFRKIAAAHRLHHSDKFEGVPYGFFLGPKVLEEVGGLEELANEIERQSKHTRAHD